MNHRRLAIVLLLLALALGANVLRGEPAAAQGREGVVWEYDVFQMDPADYADKADYRQILEQEGARRVEGAFIGHVLRHLGGDGWELVTVERRSANLLYLYMKRPARS